MRLLSEDAARHPSLPSIPAYDFSGYSTVTEEPLPAAGTHDEMRYYWDSSHFKSLVGDYALDLVLGDGSAPDRAQSDFGVTLTVDNIESVIEEQRQRQAAYRARFAEDVAKPAITLCKPYIGTFPLAGTSWSSPPVGASKRRAYRRQRCGEEGKITHV